MFKPESNILGALGFGSGLVSNCGIAGAFSFSSALVGDPAGSGLDYSFTGGSLPEGTSFTRASTGRYYNSSGYVASAANNTARFDYNPATLGLRGILIEPQRTNVLWGSTPVTNWTLQRAAASSNAATSPAGTTTASSVSEDTSLGTHDIVCNENTLFYTDENRALSIYAKAGTTTAIQLRAPTGFDPQWYANFNLSTGELGTYSQCAPSIVSVGNDWYRIGVVLDSANEITKSVFVMSFTNNNTSASIKPQYTGTSKTCYVWDAQHEVGSTISAIIPTSSSAVTRSADALSFTVPAGVSTLRYTFDDDSTQDVTGVSAGSYTVPTNLNRAWIKRIQSV